MQGMEGRQSMTERKKEREEKEIMTKGETEKIRWQRETKTESRES